MIRAFSIVLIFCLFASCSSILHSAYKLQSNKRLLKTEERNFNSEKALTQWWYFDFFLDDGSVMVVLFAPYHWWGDYEIGDDHKSLIYVSYLQADGELKTSNKIFDSKEVSFDANGLRSPYLEIIKSHKKHSREYTINISMDEIQGTTKISSTRKGFSPLPRGSLGKFGTRHILHLEGPVAYRYAAHVPKGVASCSLKLGEDSFNLSAQVYHEQGWFTGQATQMGEGWEWFHFASERVNLFGAKSFFYLELDDEILIGGLNKGDSRCQISEKVNAENTSNYILGGRLNFSSRKLSFDVLPTNSSSSPMIYIPGLDTDELWGNVMQASTIQLMYKGTEITEEGMLIIETCRMRKINLNKSADSSENPADTTITPGAINPTE